MKVSIVLVGLFMLLSCERKLDWKSDGKNLEIPKPAKQEGNGFFIINMQPNSNMVEVIPPKNLDFELPDSSAIIERVKLGDFNADRKEDVLVFLGACGTAGCMYALFLRQNKQFFKLVFLDYLKNPEFKIEKDGLWTIESYEELEPYNPSRIQKTMFKFDQDSYHYQVDSSFVLSNGEIE